MSDKAQESGEESSIEEAPHVEAKPKRASTASARKAVVEEQEASHDAAPDTEAEQPAEEDLAAAAARADEILDRAGERAGERVGQILRSGERAGQFLRSGAEQVKQFRTREQAEADNPADEVPAEELVADEPPEAVARAEVLMDRAGERVGQLLRFGGQQVHRSTALAREALEDFVAEAESIRRGTRSGPD